MPSAPAKKRTKLSSLKSQIALWKEDGIVDAKALQTKMAAYLDDREILGDDGNPVDIQAIYLETGMKEDEGAEDEAGAEAAAEDTAKAINAAVTKAVNGALKRIPDRIGKGLLITGGEAQNDEARTAGFKSASEFVLAVYAAGCKGVDQDKRLKSLQTKASPTIYGAETPGTDGGFSVPPDFINYIMRDPLGEENLLSRTNVIRTNGNNLTVPTDETTPWQTSGGVLAYWTGEAAALTQSKPQLKSINLQLQKLTILVPMTDELLQDSAAIVSYLPSKANENLTFKLGEGIFRGSGAGIPLGFLNSGTLVSVAKETAQTAFTVNVQNVAKMMARAVNPGSPGWAWYINQDVIPQLLTMTLGNVPAFLPYNAPVTGAVGSPILGYLFGRPVYVTQHCNTIGYQGDIVFCDFTQYVSGVKTTGVDAQQSIHLWFDQDITAFRFIFRMAGQPWRSTKVTPRSGTNYLSSFIALDDRTS